MKKVKIGKFEFPEEHFSKVSESAKDFIRKLLTYDPEKRPSAEVCLQHPWIVEYSQATVDQGQA